MPNHQPLLSIMDGGHPSAPVITSHLLGLQSSLTARSLGVPLHVPAIQMPQAVSSSKKVATKKRYEEKECSTISENIIETFLKVNEKMIFERAWSMLGTAACREDIMSAAALACYSAKIINRSAVLKCKDTSLFWWYFSKELYDLKKDGLSDIMESPSGGGPQIVETEDLFSRYVAPDKDDEDLILDDTGATAFAVCVESFIAHGFSRGAINFFFLMSMKTGNLKDKMGFLRKQYNCKNHQTIFDSIKEEIADGVSRGLQFFKVECFESGSTVFFVCAESQDEAEETLRVSRGLTVMRSEPLYMGIG